MFPMPTAEGSTRMVPKDVGLQLGALGSCQVIHFTQIALRGRIVAEVVSSVSLIKKAP